MAKKNFKKIKLPGTKAVGQLVVQYRQLRAEGKIGRDDTMEALNKYYGKKGQVLKRETRYNTQRGRLTEAIKKAQEKYGKTPGKNAFKQKVKKWEEAKKGAQSHGEKSVPKTKAGEADKRFTRKAREVTNRFLQAVDVFASDILRRLDHRPPQMVRCCENHASVAGIIGVEQFHVSVPRKLGIDIGFKHVAEILASGL